MKEGPIKKNKKNHYILLLLQVFKSVSKVASCAKHKITINLSNISDTLSFHLPCITRLASWGIKC